MNLQVILNTFGGLALFLLAILMMTEGLKVFAGGGLKQLLGRFTCTPLKGVLAGILVTGLVQSSSAVTVATIGFVNAGMLSLRQALGVVLAPHQLPLWRCCTPPPMPGGWPWDISCST